MSLPGWGRGSDTPPPRWSSKPPKPPKKGGLCIQIAPWAAWPALLSLGAVIVRSLT